MKVKKMLWSIALMMSLVSLVSCNAEKEVILIENAEENSKIETRLLYKALIAEEDVSKMAYTLFFYINEDKIYGRGLNNGEQETIKFGKITEDKNEDGLKKINWETLSLDYKIIDMENGIIDKKMKTYKNGKLYDLELNDGIKEKEILSDITINEKDIKYTEKIYKDLTKITKNLIINEKTGEVLDIGEVSDLYNIFHIEDNRIYISFVSYKSDNETVAGAKVKENLEKELKIGYIENGKFNDIFEDKNIVINYKDTRNQYFKEPLENVVFKNNKILFIGSINEENAIWNYDIENKELSKEIELKPEEIAFIEVSENLEKIFISIEEFYDLNVGRNNQSVEVKERKYIGEINDDLRIEKLTPLYDYNFFCGFNEDGSEIYFLDYMNNKNGTVIEAYKI